MSTWCYVTRDRHLVVDSDTWLEALPGALGELGVDATDFTPLSASSAGDETVHLRDPSGTFRMVVRPFEARGPDEMDYAILDDEPVPAQVGMAPEKLWDFIDAELDVLAKHDAPAEQAAEVLRILCEACKAESGSVLLAAPNEADFTWLAARGPRSRAVMRNVVHTNEGIAGYVWRRQAPFMVHNVQTSMRHLHRVDTATGYCPRAVLAVPLTSHDNHRLGVLELLDADPSFEPWVPKLVSHVAHRLADMMVVRWQVVD